ncbi:MAG TPA: hypothetical protein DHV30_11835, partial [Balneola sp.]|nr:hypothetical protein [Balneola sp.]
MFYPYRRYVLKLIQVFMKTAYFTPLLFLTLILLSACKNKVVMSVSGSVDYLGEANISVSEQPLHYKYSPKKIYSVTHKENGAFKIDIPISVNRKLIFTIDDQSLSLIADPNDKLNLTISRASFPLDTDFNSIHKDDYEAYKNYLSETDGLDKLIEKEMNNFKA